MNRYTLFISFTCLLTTRVLGMEQAKPATRLKKQASGILPKIKHTKTLSDSTLANDSVNEDVEESTHDYKRDAVEAFFASDPVKFNNALKKINNPEERAQLRTQWNFEIGKKINGTRKFGEYKGSHLQHSNASLKELTNDQDQTE